jgi:hypothetical protein
MLCQLIILIILLLITLTTLVILITLIILTYPADCSAFPINVSLVICTPSLLSQAAALLWS